MMILGVYEGDLILRKTQLGSNFRKLHSKRWRFAVHFLGIQSQQGILGDISSVLDPLHRLVGFESRKLLGQSVETRSPMLAAKLQRL